MKNNLALYALVVRDRKRVIDVLKSPDFQKERQTAEIIRLVHSIEKGLCIEKPRMGFGVSKLNQLLMLCSKYAERYGNDEFCLKMARDAIKGYISFHREKGYQSEDFQKICDTYISFPCKESDESESFGGTLRIQQKSPLNIDELEAFFLSRHSIRDFSGLEVSKEEITRAIHAAQYAPSACNRQAVRAYVLSSSKVCELYNNDLSGIGGFAENADKFIFITGKLSAYNNWEYNQHIVSASIFSTYLIEALHAQGIGACMVQRPLCYSSQWQSISNELGIPNDERLVLMIAIGKMKEEYNVPLSKRFPTEHILKFVE